jgi:hypothetical protein
MISGMNNGKLKELHIVPHFENLFQQEYFEPKRAFKSNDLKALVNFSRVSGTNFEPADTGFKDD